nr:MFS transporter [uncultured Dongia sp.]
MDVKEHDEGDAPLVIIAVLMFAVFTVSIGYGITLPLLPSSVESLLNLVPQAVEVSRNTGYLAAIYLLALFVFAPIWGRLSDRIGRRPVLLIGMIGFSASISVLFLFEHLWALYAERLLSGVFSAAVTPIALAAIADVTKTDEKRARQLTLISLSGIAGFLLGPMLGVFVSGASEEYLAGVGSQNQLLVPLTSIAILALLSTVTIWTVIPALSKSEKGDRSIRGNVGHPGSLIWTMLGLTFTVSFAIGLFEVDLALRGNREAGLNQYQIAVMFTECSLVMLAAQGAVFSPWIKPQITRWLIAPALLVLGAGLYLASSASTFLEMLVAVGAVAGSAGIISPILTYWISLKAGAAQGAEIGKQTAATSLGGAAGSFAGGTLIGIEPVPGLSFVVMAAAIGVGAVIAAGLPRRLEIGHAEGLRAKVGRTQ